MSIEWKEIPDFSNYKVSSDGQIASFYNNANGEIVKQSDNFGYKTVRLKRDDGTSKKVRVHRMVAIAFIPNPRCKQEVNHINGNKADNRVENLEWCTPAENIKHSYKTLNREPPVKKGSGYRIRLLNPTQVRIIRETNISCRELAELFGVHRTTINNVRTGRSYKDC